jgi:hypothetical protein
MPGARQLLAIAAIASKHRRIDELTAVGNLPAFAPPGDFLRHAPSSRRLINSIVSECQLRPDGVEKVEIASCSLMR